MPEPDSRPLLTLRMGKFVAWLASSLGALGAILYACGYLALHAHLHLLGLEGLVRHGHERYVQEGGRFFLGLGMYANELLSLFIFVALVLLALAAVLTIPLLLLKKGSVGQVRTSISRHIASRRRLWRGLAFGVLLIALFVLAQDPIEFQRPLQISGLLFGPPARAGPPADVDVARLLLEATTDSLETLDSEFLERFLLNLFSLLLLAVVWQVTAPWRSRPLVVLPFFFVAILYTISLPMLYGVLVYRMEAPVVALAGSAPADGLGSGELYLLEKTEQECLLWDPCERRVLWIPLEQVSAVEIRRTARFFGEDRAVACETEAPNADNNPITAPSR